MKVGLDLDNVLLDINKAAKAVLADQLKIPGAEIIETHLYNQPFTHRDPAIATLLKPTHGFWEREEVLIHCEPLPGAVEAAWRLYDASLLGGYVTRRPPSVASLTNRVLSRFVFPPMPAHHVGNDDEAKHYTVCKSAACLSRGITHMVDDQPHEAATLTAAGIDVILVDAPTGRAQRLEYLRHNPSMPLAADVTEAVDLILRHTDAA